MITENTDSPRESGFWNIQFKSNGLLAFFKGTEPEPEIVPELILTPTRVPGADVYRDVVYLYTNILMDSPEGESVGHS